MIGITEIDGGYSVKVTSPKIATELLQNSGLKPNKNFSQNFLVDENITTRIGEAASDDFILEIGPGLGALTQELAKHARKVLAYEIDRGLFTVLQNTLKETTNVKIINQDAMKADLKGDTEREFAGEFSVAANLPYHITTPLIMRFLEEDLPVKKMVLMMQKEVAQRIVAGETGERSAFTLAVAYYSHPKMLFTVSRNCFLPKPNVDSAVVCFDIQKRDFAYQKQFFMLTRGLFGMKRKTIANNFSRAFGVSKERAEAFFKDLDLNPSFRAEQLKLEDYLKMATRLENFLKK